MQRGLSGAQKGSTLCEFGISANELGTGLVVEIIRFVLWWVVVWPVDDVPKYTIIWTLWIIIITQVIASVVCILYARPSIHPLWSGSARVIWSWLCLWTLGQTSSTLTCPGKSSSCDSKSLIHDTLRLFCTYLCLVSDNIVMKFASGFSRIPNT